MPRIKSTPTVKIVLCLLPIYVLGTLALIAYKFVRTLFPPG